MKKSLTIIIILLNVLFAFSQKSGPKRIEIKTKVSINNYKIFPIGSKGLILINQSNQKENNQRIIFFSRYDKNLKSIWTKKILIERYFLYEEYFHSDDKLYVFFKAVVGGKVLIQVVCIDIISDNISNLKYSIPFKGKIDYYKIINNSVYLAGEISPTFIDNFSQVCFSFTLVPLFTGLKTYKIKPFIIIHDLINNTNKKVLPQFKGDANIIDVSANKNSGTINVVFENYVKPKKKVISVNEYNNEAELLSSININTLPDKNLLTGKIIKTDKNEKIFIGTYSNSTSKRKKSSNISEGLYFSKIANNKQEFNKYYNFNKFKNFYATISAQLKKRIIKKNQKGKTVNVGYNLLVHDEIFQKNGQYIVIAEAYYPEYHTEWRYDSYGRAYTVEVFDGWRYTHAIIAAFDKDGKLIWDNTFEIMDIISYKLKERVKILKDEESIVMIYSAGGYLHSKIIEGTEVIEKKESIKIPTKFKDDAVRKNYNSDIAHWYDNYFITWGFQKIRNASLKKREVFYFNKIAFQ